MKDLKVSEIQKKIRTIVAERKWEKFHTPKNLAVALALEASELLENFNWLTDEQSELKNLAPKKIEAIGEEMADVIYNLVRLADLLQIDLNDAFWKKIIKIEAKYPVELARGNAKKYTEF